MSSLLCARVRVCACVGWGQGGRHEGRHSRAAGQHAGPGRSNGPCEISTPPVAAWRQGEPTQRQRRRDVGGGEGLRPVLQAGVGPGVQRALAERHALGEGQAAAQLQRALGPDHRLGVLPHGGAGCGEAAVHMVGSLACPTLLVAAGWPPAGKPAPASKGAAALLHSLAAAGLLANMVMPCMRMGA